MPTKKPTSVKIAANAKPNAALLTAARRYRALAKRGAIKSHLDQPHNGASPAPVVRGQRMRHGRWKSHVIGPVRTHVKAPNAQNIAHAHDDVRRVERERRHSDSRIPEIGREESKTQNLAGAILIANIRASQTDITALDPKYRAVLIRAAFTLADQFNAHCNKRWKKLP